MSLIPVILCGGSGTRLWPLSREAYPKQFLTFNSQHSLFQETALRLTGNSDIASPLVVTNAEYRFLVAEQLRQIGVGPQDILLEPVPRNTAPAIAAAAFLALRKDQDAVLLVLPSDHFIAAPDAFRELLPEAQRVAMHGALVTFGIVPDSPHTGYGYIRLGAPHSTKGIYEVASFVEKPDEAVANAFLASGDYLWNSGMFVFRADCFLNELKSVQPDTFDYIEKSVHRAERDLDFIRLSSAEFAACRSDSIDYAVMERTSRAVVIAADVGWSDVGSWAAIADMSESDGHGNTFHGDVTAHNVKNCLIRAEKRMIAASGLRDLVVVETADAVLVVHKQDTQGVKQIVAGLNAAGRSEGKIHSRVYRPWGHYESTDAGQGFQVKRIVVNPGAALSLQLHYRRAEHWIVVKGTASVIRGKDEFSLGENESTYIPVGVKHRLANRGTSPLEVIEVQSGAYLGEDDIVRFEDVYGRD